MAEEKEPEFIDPNSGAAPQPGGFVAGQPVPEEEDSSSTTKKSSGSGKTAKKTSSSSDKS